MEAAAVAVQLSQVAEAADTASAGITGAMIMMILFWVSVLVIIPGIIIWSVLASKRRRRINQEAAEAKYWTCAECGTEKNDGDFCTECGAPRPKDPVCPQCGFKPEKGKTLKYCPKCGTKME